MNWLDKITKRTLPTLARGSHKPGDQRACLMELISVMEGEDFSDHPKCVDPTLQCAGMHINDGVSDWVRNDLLRLAPMFVGTHDPDDMPLSPLVVNAGDAVTYVEPKRLQDPFTGYEYHSRGIEGERAMMLVWLADAWFQRYNLEMLHRRYHEPRMRRDPGYKPTYAPHPVFDNGFNQQELHQLADAQRGYDEARKKWRHQKDRGHPIAMLKPDHELFMHGCKLVLCTLGATAVNPVMHRMLASEAFGTLEGMIKVGPHTPEMRGWLEEPHLTRAKDWVLEYA